MVKIGLRIWILIIFLLLSVLAIGPTFKSGVLVSSVEPGSELQTAGLKQGDVIKLINGEQVKTQEDYTKIVTDILSGAGEKRVDVTTEDAEFTVLIKDSLQMTVSDIPMTKIKTGLDLVGGARALVQAVDVTLTDEQLQDLLDVSRNRFNVYGVSDVQVKAVSDLSGNKYMLIEIAGATPNDLEKLISEQGKFEAKVGNETVFTGGTGDIASVARGGQQAGITGCQQSAESEICSFRFTVFLTPSAAERHAEITKGIQLDDTGQYLKEKLYLYVDDEEVDSLLISANLKGQVTTEISIQGSGSGATREEALADAQSSMKNLQTILITGSLPYKLEIVKLDTISPVLGGTFIRTIFLAGFVAILLVSIIIFLRYRNFKASLALLLTSFSEIIIILGVAAFLKWNFDLPSIAGILATIGTGVDDQIVILDETTRNKSQSLKERIKRAFFIIIGAYVTTFVSLLPLNWAGAGLFKGFAFTTMIGITASILITRPAFAEIIRRIKG